MWHDYRDVRSGFGFHLHAEEHHLSVETQRLRAILLGLVLGKSNEISLLLGGLLRQQMDVHLLETWVTFFDRLCGHRTTILEELLEHLITTMAIDGQILAPEDNKD